MDNLDVSSGFSDSEIVLLVNGLDFMLNLIDVDLASVKSFLQTSNGGQMSLETNVVAVQMMSENNHFAFQRDSDVVPVMDSVAPDSISCSMSSNSDCEVMHCNSVSVDRNLMSLEGNSKGGYHIFFMSD
jgi:hypothetical protein